MKLSNILLPLFVLFFLNNPAHATDFAPPADQKALIEAVQNAGGATILVPEDGGKPRAMVGDATALPAAVPVETPEEKEAPIQFTGGFEGGLYGVMVGANGRLALRFFDAGEVGALAGGAGSFGAALFVGGYAALSPVPYKFGKRIYLYGRYYRAWVYGPENGSPTVPFHFFEGGVGYRQKIKESQGVLAGKSSSNSTFHVEVGWARALGCIRQDCTDFKDDFGLPMVRAGVSY
jgi:hypothetical protein